MSLPPDYAPRMECELASSTASLPTCDGVRITLQALDVRHMRPPHNGIRVTATIEGNDHGARFLVVPQLWSLADATHGALPAKLETMGGERATLEGSVLTVHTPHPDISVRRVAPGASTIDSLRMDGWCFLPTEGAAIELVLATDVRVAGSSVDAWLPTEELPDTSEPKPIPMPEHAPIAFDAGCRIVASIDGAFRTL